MATFDAKTEIEKILKQDLDLDELKSNNIEEIGGDMDSLAGLLNLEMQEKLQYYDVGPVLDKLYECETIEDIVVIVEKLQAGVASGEVTLLSDVEGVDFNELVINCEKYDLKEGFFD